jgi:CHAT domain-containing protein/tetratricopeptide (TPR) repeat protein
MKRFPATFLFICLSILSFSQKNHNQFLKDYYADYKKAEKLFEQAEQLSAKADFNEEIQQLQDRFYSKALAKFQEIANKDSENDSLSFHTFIKIGLISHYFDSLKSAKRNYLKAIGLKAGLPNIQDSFLFKPYLFLGGILYDEHEFDSASACYQKAEQIQNSYKVALDESQRLYNKLGGIYYETGNYRLAMTYFKKALSLLSSSQASYTPLVINYEINIASILVKLEHYDDAKKLYESILPYKIYENEIWHNIGIINSHIGKFKEAIEDFKRVKYPNSNKSIDLDYNLAVAFDSLHQYDSVFFYLQKAFSEDKKFYRDQKNTAFGLVLKFSADKKTEERKYGEALNYYQQAIVQFDVSFNDINIYKNPVQFSGIFSYINLFNTLTAKAETFEQYYRINKDEKDLEASLDAFRSAFKLADYVEKTYESDESRLFLNRIKYSAHSKPIDVCLELYKLTKEKKYLEEAYLFDQKNKASILSLNLQLNEMRKQAGIPVGIISKETALKSAITRLSLKAAQANKSIGQNQINNEISNLEIQLAKLQQLLNKNPRYSQLQPSDRIPSVSVIQNKMLDKKTALLSYHLSENELLILVITPEKFEYNKQPIDKSFYTLVDSFLKDLHSVNPGEKYKGVAVSKDLYKALIEPVFPLIRNCTRLVIIPDDELNYVPFEALQDRSNHYLLESFAMQYQYSTALLNMDSENKNIVNHKTLAFAPFTGDDPQDKFETLNYSKTEVENLDGKILTGKDASKENFIAAANHYNIIHLATHAGADDKFPLRSFIAFFPAEADSNYLLYAAEIYNLQLDSTQLIILSACETGTGKLEKGEGLMSLSRAFAYAGCPNIVTSVWKAEDKTTAFITKQLHVYLQKGLSKDEALQKAKLDLLYSNEIEPRFKTPNYWAHLVFIGNYVPQRSSSFFWWIAGTITILTVLFFFFKKKPRR